MENIDIDIDIDKDILENIDIDINIDKEILENIDIDIDKDILENIDINIDKEILENIDIDKDILENIDIVINIDKGVIKIPIKPVRHNYFRQCFTSSENSNKLIWIDCGEDAIRIQQIHVTAYAQILLNGTREILVVVSKKYIIHSTATWSGGN